MAQKYVIVDIDDTVAMPGDRNKYLLEEPINWEAFYADPFEDEPKIEMVNLVKNLSCHYRIVFCTGRSERVRKKTKKWLDKYFEGLPINDYTLLMRPDGDPRPDHKLKPKMIYAMGIKLKNVALIIDNNVKFCEGCAKRGVQTLVPI